MGYTTEFMGGIDVVPALNEQEIEFLRVFSETRRMKRKEGPYYVDRDGNYGQDLDNPNVIDSNQPHDGQPGLWCQWVSNDEGTVIEWDEGEKFYNSAEWMAYIIEHFLGQHPLAKKELPFLQGHVLNGIIDAAGESYDDRWQLIVNNNKVYTQELILAPDPETPPKLIGGNVLALENKS